MNRDISAMDSRIKHKEIIVAVAVVLILIASLYAIDLYLLQPAHYLPLRAGTKLVMGSSVTGGTAMDRYSVYFIVNHNNMTLVGAWVSNEPVVEFVILTNGIYNFPNDLNPVTHGILDETLTPGNYSLTFVGSQGTVITVTKTIELIG